MPETDSVQPLWSPSPDRAGATNIDRYRRDVAAARGLDLSDTDALHAWSVTDPGGFWSEVWDRVGIIGDKGETALVRGETMREAMFFPDATLNVVENLLDGRGLPGDAPAIEYRREDGLHRTMSWNEVRTEAAAFAAALVEAGVGPGDRVAAWMPHMPETVIAMLGSAAIGAVFTSTSADFGTAGVVDRFGQVEPKVLVAADGYLYGGSSFDRMGQLVQILDELPTVEVVVMVPNLGTPDPGSVRAGVAWDEFVGARRGDALPTERFAFDHPHYILYSSGTTGKPKCMVHKAGGVLLKHMQEQQHHLDIRTGDRVFYFTTCGWMMWNWLVSALATGATIVLFDGNPFQPGPEALFDLVDDLDITLLGVSAKYIDAVLKSGIRPVESHRLASLRTIASTGSPLSPEGFAFVYDGIKEDVHLASISGGTDLCGCFVGGDPTKAVYAGEIQAKALGMAVEVFDDDGRPSGPGVQGELVCTEPFPSMPITFWGPGGDERYRQAYFDRFPGVWTHGDYAMWTERGGMVILGRSDATLNAAGVRIGTAEIYRVVEQFPEVLEAVAVAQRQGSDTRVVLFVRMAEGSELTPELEAEIRARLRAEESPRHIPAIIATVGDIPRTRSGKISELAVTAVVNGDQVKNTEALANPEALDLYREREELSTP
ncbi:MAG TPA: acetoacetate--CoA ligase [Acidimicrobiia bacterium]|nr:acetoacetate--CoA ligase [Acidimicrobiia bacterium]